MGVIRIGSDVLYADWFAVLMLVTLVADDAWLAAVLNAFLSCMDVTELGREFQSTNVRGRNANL